MSNASNALRCFEENIRLFANAHAEPEKYNLYNGLANLATAVKEMQDDVQRLRQDVMQLRR